MAFTQVTVTQDYNSADWTEPSGTVIFTPVVPMLNSGVVVPAVPVTARLDGAGTISITLVADTDPSTTPTGGYYGVVELINGVRRSYNVVIPHDQGSSVVLYSLAQMSTAPATSFPPAPRVAIDSQSGTSYTLTTADAGKAVQSTGSSAFTLTVPANASQAFAIGDMVLVAQIGTGQITLTAAGGVTLRTASSLTTRAQWSEISIRKIATDEWLVAGDTT